MKKLSLLITDTLITDTIMKKLYLFITDTMNENVKLSDYWYTNYWYYKWRSYTYSLLMH